MGDSGVRLIERLPERYAGSDPSFPPTRFRVHVGRAIRDVVVNNGTCVVESPSGRPDAEIATDADTWRRIWDGRLSGIEAFLNHKLNVRRSIDRSLAFEPLFERPAGVGLRYSIEEVDADGLKFSTLFAGDEGADPVLLIHGLGATKASWITLIPALARSHRVVAIDLPGFGASSKPSGRYDAPWFAERVFRFLDTLGYDSACVAGNSMGGRIALEMAMANGGRVRALACLCPAAAFTHRPALWLARLIRPEVGFLVGRLPRARVREMLTQLFAQPSRIDKHWYEAAVDDFLSSWRSPRARRAFSRSLRNIYLDEPHGEKGFWTRLADLETPALFIYGKQDALITHHFGAKIAETLPAATVHLWDDCGHVPQLEHPERTADTVLRFFRRAAQPHSRPA